MLACVLRATRWHAVFLPKGPVVALASCAHHSDNGAADVTCSADLELPDINLLLVRASAAQGLAVLDSRPAPHALFLALSLDVTLRSDMGDVELWFSPGAYVQGLRV